MLQRCHLAENGHATAYKVYVAKDSNRGPLPDPGFYFFSRKAARKKAAELIKKIGDEAIERRWPRNTYYRKYPEDKEEWYIQYRSKYVYLEKINIQGDFSDALQ